MIKNINKIFNIKFSRNCFSKVISNDLLKKYNNNPVIKPLTFSSTFKINSLNVLLMKNLHTHVLIILQDNFLKII